MFFLYKSDTYADESFLTRICRQKWVWGCIVWPLLGACQGGNNTHVGVVYSELLGTLRNAGRSGCIVWPLLMILYALDCNDMRCVCVGGGLWVCVGVCV